MVKKAELISVLKEIEARDGLITPIAVVNEARTETSPIHDLFDWNDEEAAEKYRVWQARHIISTVRVTLYNKPVDAFHNVVVQIDEMPTNGYVSVERIASDEQLHTQVVRQAVDEIEHWNTKYKEVTELRGVVDEKKFKRVRKTL